MASSLAKKSGSNRFLPTSSPSESKLGNAVSPAIASTTSANSVNPERQILVAKRNKVPNRNRTPNHMTPAERMQVVMEKALAEAVEEFPKGSGVCRNSKCGLRCSFRRTTNSPSRQVMIACPCDVLKKTYCNQDCLEAVLGNHICNNVQPHPDSMSVRKGSETDILDISYLDLNDNEAPPASRTYLTSRDVAKGEKLRTPLRPLLFYPGVPANGTLTCVGCWADIDERDIDIKKELSIHKSRERKDSLGASHNAGALVPVGSNVNESGISRGPHICKCGWPICSTKCPVGKQHRKECSYIGNIQGIKGRTLFHRPWNVDLKTSNFCLGLMRIFILADLGTAEEKASVNDFLALPADSSKLSFKWQVIEWNTIGKHKLYLEQLGDPDPDSPRHFRDVLTKLLMYSKDLSTTSPNAHVFGVYPIQFKSSDEPNSKLILDEGIPVCQLAMCDIKADTPLTIRCEGYLNA